MSLVIGTKPKPPNPGQGVPATLPDAYRTNLLDRSEWTTTQITTQLQGYPWPVRSYYSQVLGQDNAPKAPQFDAPAVYQQYAQILGMQLAVSSPLNNEQNIQTKSFQIRGEATIPPGLIPKQGDAFVTEGPDGNLALFVVEETRKLTPFVNSAYVVTYEMKNVFSAAMDTFFTQRVVTKLHFKQDYLRAGRYPYLTTDELVTVENLVQQRRNLTHQFNRMFYNPQVEGYPVPDFVTPTYDHFATTAWVAMAEFNGFGPYNEIIRYNVKGSTLDRAWTIWDVLFRKREWNPDMITKEMVVTDTHRSRHQLGLFNISPMIFPQLLVPTGQDSFPGSLDAYAPITGWPIWERPCGQPAEPPVLPPIDPSRPPVMYPVKGDPGYILSMNFYNGNFPQMSLLERLVWRAVNREVMELPILLEVYKGIATLPPIDRYYGMLLVYCLMTIYEWR